MALAHGLVSQNRTADYLPAGLLVGASLEPRFHSADDLKESDYIFRPSSLFDQAGSKDIRSRYHL